MDLIPEELSLMEEGVYVTKNGDCLKGITVFNMSIGEQGCVEADLRNKATEVVDMARMMYAEELEDEHSQEL